MQNYFLTWVHAASTNISQDVIAEKTSHETPLPINRVLYLTGADAKYRCSPMEWFTTNIVFYYRKTSYFLSAGFLRSRLGPAGLGARSGRAEDPVTTACGGRHRAFRTPHVCMCVCVYMCITLKSYTEAVFSAYILIFLSTWKPKPSYKWKKLVSHIWVTATSD